MIGRDEDLKRYQSEDPRNGTTVATRRILSMSRVADGATTRRERILEMLNYIRGFQPRGVSLPQIQLHMSMAHGLTFKKTQEYIYEMEMGGVLFFEAGRVRMIIENFRRLMELMAPDRNPDTGEKLGFSDVLDNLEDPEKKHGS